MIKALTALAISASAVFLFSAVSLAQAPVASREAVPRDSSSSASTQLVLEIQALREEISSLRGTIEELEYQVDRLERKQTENYSDLDSRVANLYSGSVSLPASANNAASAPSTPSVPVTAPSPTSESNGANTNATAEARGLYDQGFSSLRQGDRDSAIQTFKKLVESYPDSREAPDARYWLGETYWLANKKEESRQVFVQLLERTPDYRKAGDAMYRLGVIYDQLGDSDTAFDYMSKVLLSGSSQSVAAQAWINEHQSQKPSAEDSTNPSN